MTISNLVVQPDAAYLLSDTAFFQPDGRILGFGTKVLAFFGQKAAVSATGRQGLAIGKVYDEYRRTGAAFSFDGFLQTVRDVYEREGYDPDEFAMVWNAAYYSDAHKRPFGFSFTTHSSGGGEGFQPWRWHPKTALIMPHVDPSEVFGPGIEKIRLADPRQFNPLTDFKMFAMEQRKHRFEGLYHAVGGEVRLTKVSSAGVETWTMHDFGDQEGQIVTLHRQDLLPKSLLPQ